MKLRGEMLYVRLLWTRLSWLIPCTALLAACGHAESPVVVPNPCDNPMGPPFDRLVVTPHSVTVAPGDTLRFSASLNPCSSAARPQTIRWTVADTTIVAIDSLGLVRARKSGTTSVIATPAPDSTSVEKGAAAITVSP